MIIYRHNEIPMMNGLEKPNNNDMEIFLMTVMMYNDGIVMVWIIDKVSLT